VSSLERVTLLDCSRTSKAGLSSWEKMTGKKSVPCRGATEFVTAWTCSIPFQTLIEDIPNIGSIILMIEHIQYFQKGTVYRIRNRKTKKDLCLSSKMELKTRVP